MKSAREAAARALLRVHTAGSYSNLVLESYRKAYNLSPQDKAFAEALFSGVLQREITLDHVLSGYCKTPLKRLSPVVREVLRCGIYQLLYMDSVPDSAAVNESVNLVRAMGVAKSAGFVNGVLRAFLRAGKQIPPVQGDVPTQLSVTYSCPKELTEKLILWLGETEATAFLAASLAVPATYLRVNTTRTTPAELLAQLQQQGIDIQPDEHLPACLVANQGGALHHLPQWQEGLFRVQDKSSQLCVLALDAKPGQRVLDVCAAPGGKSLTAAQIMQNTGELVAGELHAHRVDLIKDAAAREGLSCIRAVQADAQVFDPALGEFDRVLCDVPCSGLGVIGRKPEIKYKKLADFENLPSLQYKILENSSQYVKVGGRLLYSTCTVNPAENGDVVAAFAKAHPEFRPAPLPAPLGEESCRTIGSEFASDGFFMAAFEKMW